MIDQILTWVDTLRTGGVMREDRALLTRDHFTAEQFVVGSTAHRHVGPVDNRETGVCVQVVL